MAAIIGLLAVTVLALVKNPHVNDQYRAYFIDRTTDCWPLPIDGAIAWGEQLSFVGAAAVSPTYPLRRCGWMEPQDTGTWSMGPEAVLRLNPGPRARDLLLDLEMLPFVTTESPVQTVRLTLAGTDLATLTLDAASSPQHRFILPAALASSSGPIDVGFHFPTAHSPSAAGMNDDRRRLAIRLLSVRITEADGTAH
ncbi:hypothetical protein [Devosia sp. SL43]|uniref:hypothetical protein n=1 Tax=Devosia sp. SL43 TaxID=2806348 RepID=UPI001F317AC8|nr:hypothetical protein [Devosia sp. SL43]UJW87209.1 hypothetical protein IM737_08205 [Devosia sp. SL43]